MTRMSVAKAKKPNLKKNNVRAAFPEKLSPIFKACRYKILYGGRGGSKSWGVARALLILGSYKKLRILCAREFMASLADSVHKLLCDQIDYLNLDAFYTPTKNIIRGKNGTEFQFCGLGRNIAGVKSKESVDIVWVEEAANVSKRSWDTLVPTIRKEGSEIWMSFNPEYEEDETYIRYVLHPPTNSIIIKINWRDNPYFPKVLNEERIAHKERDPSTYAHVWEGECIKWMDGAIFAKELRDAYAEDGSDKKLRITVVKHDPEFPVHTAWDIGRTDDTAIWFFQFVGGEIRLIDYYANNFCSPSHYCSQIIGKEAIIDLIEKPNPDKHPDAPPTICRVEAKIGKNIPELAFRRKYRLGKHWLPHDGRAATFQANGKTAQEQLASVLGKRSVAIVPRLSEEDLIQAGRLMFPRCWFDKDKCREGLLSLRKYHRKLQSDDISHTRKAYHDWSSHASDAFCYMAVVCRYEQKKLADSVGHTITVNAEGTYTMKDLWSEHHKEVDRRRGTQRM